MNPQRKFDKEGQVAGRGIEWTEWTWNLVAGCKHHCRWQMPDGKIAICYAENVANGIAAKAYPDGFEHHYWHPARMTEPAKLKEPSLIFLDSMSDLFGHWVPELDIRKVLQVVADCPQHMFQSLTKNPKRMLKFDLPFNLWAGFSTPPDFMWGEKLTDFQKDLHLDKDLETMAKLKATVKWCSFEPLSRIVSTNVEAAGAGVLDWAVIGPASNGRQTYQPDPAHLNSLRNALDQFDVPIFYKGNLEATPWREEWPKKMLWWFDPELNLRRTPVVEDLYGKGLV